jgi:hypothetical protein
MDDFPDRKNFPARMLGYGFVELCEGPLYTVAETIFPRENDLHTSIIAEMRRSGNDEEAEAGVPPAGC